MVCLTDIKRCAVAFQKACARKFVALCLLCGVQFGYGAVGERLNWGSGLTLLGFFEQNLIPLKLYYNLSPQDKEAYC